MTVALRRFPTGSPHMNAVGETWRRSRLDTPVCEYRGSLEGEKATGRVLQNDKVQSGLVRAFAETSFAGNNIAASL